MLSIHERVSKQDESEREIKEEIIENITALAKEDSCLSACSLVFVYKCK